MDADAERQALFMRRLGKITDDVPVRPDIDAVPRLVFAVVEIQVVVMVAIAKKYCA